MTKVIMLTTMKGREHDTVKLFEQGKEYDITDLSLFDVFITQQWCKLSREPYTRAPITPTVQIETAPVAEPTVSETAQPEYYTLGLPELKKFAKVSKINIGAAKHKEEILALLDAHYDSLVKDLN